MAAKTAYSKNVAPVKLELLITIVNASRTAYFTGLIQSFDANMHIITQASGTSDTALLNYLGLDKSTRTAIFSIIREDRRTDLMETLQEKFRSIKDGQGIAVAIPLSSVIGTLVYGFFSNDKRAIKEGQI